jgi:SAM-dependent methyltransferase
MEPFVDLGAGKSATLVNHLREQGVAATGIDRLAVSPHVLAKDWFEIRFEPNSLGTLVSHLAFSLHFLHHHWNPGDKAYAYAKKYMELLAALKPGGLFVYAPGLPFIETMLDAEQYRIERQALPEPLAEKMENYRDLGTGQSVAYVTHIRRLK